MLGSGVACGGMLTIQRSTWIQTRHGQSIFASTQQPTLQASGYYNSWPLLFMILRRQEVSKPSSLSGLSADTTAIPCEREFLNSLQDGLGMTSKSGFFFAKHAACYTSAL